MELEWLPSTVIPPSAVTLTFWLFDLISMFQAQVHTWPNFGEISWNIYEDIVFIWYNAVIAAATLTFDPKI